ncbi:hypothetical protein KY290_015929 [Solanum tuberosum]|uniref:DUF4283 domain-containing protein n=1 Tax=Solanum tuberosum TaxID=4113 RepID=A0ABQ7VU31_SOLTU|nr:hypothetical protein KY289_014264 [Solanum tuberosum]KAH0701347.1 hypothetical protein KY284_015562 [Solanum tuberosum]KAH0771948.1 hypothetical protein KY290_015929 [Solanum tuberosum]
MTILTGDKAKVQVMGIHDMEGKEQWPALVGSKTPILHTETPIQTPVIGIGMINSEQPVRNGETVVELSKTEVELEIQRWKHALILYVVGANPTIAALEEDRDEVLYAGPHMLNNKTIIVKTWSPEFDFNNEVMQTIPIWVKFPNLPLNCWGVNSLSRIGSGLGVPIYADECTTQVDRLSYARVLIEMDITKTLPIELKVKDPNVPKHGGVAGRPTTRPRKRRMEWKTRAEGGKVVKGDIPGTITDPSTSTIQEVVNDETVSQEQHEKETPWKELRGKSAAKGGLNFDKGITSTANEFNVLRDHVTRLVVAGGGGQGGSRILGRVYGLHTIEDRRSLWGKLRSINLRQQGPWLSMGDCNAIHRAEDRLIGSTIHEVETKDFDSFLKDTGMAILRANGREFTWNNGHTYNIIDWALVNAIWLLDMQSLEVQIMNPGCSNHSPLRVVLAQEEDRRHRPFKFLNHLAQHGEFQRTVQMAWQQSHNTGTMYEVWQKLKRVKIALKELNIAEYQGVETRIKMYR